MGPALKASNPDAPSHHLPLALRAFPSPAISNVSLESPSLAKSVSSPDQWPPRSVLFDLNILPSEPGAARQAPVMTPPVDRCHQRADSAQNMDLIVGGALAPVHEFPPLQPAARSGRGLRLPSFEVLGIAAPRLDLFAHEDGDGLWAELARERAHDSIVRPHSNPEPREVLRPASVTASRHVDNDVQSREVLTQALTSPRLQYVHTLTPPAESGEPEWPSAMDCVLAAAPVASPAIEANTLAGGAVAGGPSALVPAATSQDTPSPLPAATGARAWVEGAVNAILTNLRTAPTENSNLKVLSHALPSPSQTGHTYPLFIQSIHDSTPSSPTVWINVFHAIPGRFNLEELPTSPPSTPGLPIGDDDYFTQKVFGSAVPVSDYQQECTSLPRSPRPIVPPSSIDVAIVERYIPPSSQREFKDMFTVEGPSILIDRLVELSPNNGSLVFIYPTKTGARTFMDEYLSPVLDPILRSMVVTHGFSSDLSAALGNMSAVNQLPELAELERKATQLCTRLTQRSSGMARFHGRRAHFSLVYAAKREVPLTRQAWAKDWWTKQEKARVTEVVTKALQEAQTKSSNRHVDRPPTATELWQKLLKDVENRPYDEGQEPRKGVEVAVFIIKRSE